MREYVQKMIAKYERRRAKPPKWRKEPTWALYLVGGGASAVSAFYAFAVTTFGPDVFMAANATPVEQWSGVQIFAMIALGGCGYLAWYYLGLAAKPLKALNDRLFKD